MSEPRDVIARALDNLPDGDFLHSDLADAILTALADAGYDVVKRVPGLKELLNTTIPTDTQIVDVEWRFDGSLVITVQGRVNQPLPPPPGPFNPFGKQDGE